MAKGPAKGPDKERIVFYLPRATARALRHAVVNERDRPERERHVSLSSLLESLVNDYLKRKGAK